MRLTRFRGLTLLIPPGVYTPRSDTALLAEALPDVRGASVLELCAGSGAVALTAARAGARCVIAVDRSPRAVHAIRANAALNGLRVHARRGDLTAALGRDERFDVIVANPPYLPAVGLSDAPDPRWDGGADGRAVVDRVLDAAGAHLRPGGALVVVQSHLTGLEATAAGLSARGLEITGYVEHRGPLGPIASARRDALVAAGAHHAEPAAGDGEEILAVFTARADAGAPAAVRA